MKAFQGSIAELIPHRASMLLVDRLLESTPEMVRVEAVVRRDGVFMTEEGLPAWVGIELMAQTVASWVGLRQWEAQAPVKLGFLLGTRKYECFRSVFPVGARLEITATQELVAENGLAVFACSIHHEGQLVAQAQLNGFQPPDVEAYLREAVDG